MSSPKRASRMGEDLKKLKMLYFKQRTLAYFAMESIPTQLVWIQMLCDCLIKNKLTCLVESNPVKQEVRHSVASKKLPNV